MKTFNLNLQGVLDKELYTSPPLMSVVVAKINGTYKDIPKAFRLTKHLCTSDLRHLRRIKNRSNGDIDCIVARCEYSDAEGQQKCIETIKETIPDDQLFTQYRIEQVPSSAPRTDHQLKACAEIWPCKFAKSNYLIQCIEGSVFSEPEKLVLKIIVNKLLNHIEDQSQDVQSGAVIFRCAQVYGVGLASDTVLASNPTKHATMLSIDSVSKNAGGGHWEESSEQQVLVKSIQEELDKHEELAEHRIDAKFLPYLCTNYDILVTEEPCMMCSMGLVQSRIRRLLYLSAESLKRLKHCRKLCYQDSAIERFYVHRERSLNHRFEAWRVELLDEET